MSFTVGIGIITYNRAAIVRDTIDRVRAFTQAPDTTLVVADDVREGTEQFRLTPRPDQGTSDNCPESGLFRSLYSQT